MNRPQQRGWLVLGFGFYIITVRGLKSEAFLSLSRP